MEAVPVSPLLARRPLVSESARSSHGDDHQAQAMIHTAPTTATTCPRSAITRIHPRSPSSLPFPSRLPVYTPQKHNTHHNQPAGSTAAPPHRQHARPPRRPRQCAPRRCRACRGTRGRTLGLGGARKPGARDRGRARRRTRTTVGGASAAPSEIRRGIRNACRAMLDERTYPCQLGEYLRTRLEGIPVARGQRG